MAEFSTEIEWVMAEFSIQLDWVMAESSIKLKGLWQRFYSNEKKTLQLPSERTLQWTRPHFLRPILL